MKRLVAFGCSHTYGFGLKDPSKEAWPMVLGNLLEVQKTVNKGEPAASIKEIAHTALNFKYLPTDTVVFLWTHLNRYCILDRVGYVRINPRFAINKDPLSVYYYRNFYTEYDAMFQSRSYIISTDYLIRKKVTNVYHTFSDKKGLELLSKHIQNEYYYNKHFLRLRKYGRALDKSHLGAKANEVFAKEVYNFINDSFALNEKTKKLL
jgi:hypothetical protein